MAAVSASPLRDSASDVNKLTYEIFSILENNFLFGYDNPKFPKTAPPPADAKPTSRGGSANGKVRILSIDGGGATGGLLAARSLAHLESVLRRKSGDPAACIADFFDVAAGSGAGGLLAALLFTRRKDSNSPLFSAEDALKLLAGQRRKSSWMLRRFSRANRELAKIFGDGYTLKDTVKPVLIPCYDLSSEAPFVFSRADALETDGYDFRMRDVCAATSARKPVEVRSVDGRTKIMAVDGRIAMNNPTAAAITHVLNNKQEFPFCNGVEDLLVLSLGNGGSDFGAGNSGSTRSGLCRIAEDGASDMVDQAVSMAFGQSLETSYVRIQALGVCAKERESLKGINKLRKSTSQVLECVEAMLVQKYVKSVMFQGKKMTEDTNMDKIENFAGEIIKEQDRRKTSILPPVVLKQAPHHYAPSPRTSSATTLSSISSS
ncbi:patatin-like protein 3 [Punica granatum]|uniref:Patatin n=2 Tax=Punica granatum TaxID=22663 RepID=A0A218WPC4_PUNGR|nr:patatin-like protein 3 [Punica granatum]OWM74684.1 hypothetical protein CDL15_Pgr004647 [Punica granatum]PKI63892.1 hypothetical protein CRG98_015728 [Punica granatum]